VTGAGGYLGSRLCRYFRERDACVFQLTGNPKTADASLPAAHFSLAKSVEKGFFRENGIEVLVHAAYDFRPSSRKDIWDSNVKGSIALFQQAQHEGVRRVLFVSTMSAYDGCRSLYGQAKLEIEAALYELGLGFVVRPGLIYSTPLDGSGGLMGSMLRRVQRGGLLPLMGGGKQELYLTHEEDLGRFIEWLTDQSIERGNAVKRKGYFTTANPKPYAFRRILELLSTSANSENVRFLSIPWRAAWFGLKTLEAVGVNSGFRSDSMLRLAYQQKRPDFSTLPQNFLFRDFEEAIRN